MDLLTGKLISMFLLGGLSLFFGLIPLKVQKKLMKTDDGKPAEIQKKQRRRRDLVVSCLLCFGAGVLLATVFIHMLPETREGVALIFKTHYGETAAHETGQGEHMHEEGEHNHDHKGPISRTEGMNIDSNNNAINSSVEVSSRIAGVEEKHAHGGTHHGNHVHKRSAEAASDDSKQIISASAGSSTVGAHRTALGPHNEHDHTHDHDHLTSGVAGARDPEHEHGNEPLNKVGNSGNAQAPASVGLSPKNESKVAGDNHSHDHSNHDHAHDHSDHDHAPDHSDHDHAHKVGLTSSEPTNLDKDQGTGRGLANHTGHLHDHDHGPHDHDHGPNNQTHDSLQRDGTLPHFNESIHDHDHDHHEHDHETELLPLHDKDRNSTASVHNLSEDGHGDHNHDALGQESHGHSDGHGEHNHEHEVHIYPIAELLICIGFFFVYLIEEIIHKIVFHKHSHNVSKRNSHHEGGMVLKNRHSEENKLPPVTNGTYRSKSLHANVHPYAAENGFVSSGDLGARTTSDGSFPPRDVWSTTGVDNPSFVNEQEAEGPFANHAKESELGDVALQSPMVKSNSHTVAGFPFETGTSNEPLFLNNHKKSMKNKSRENNNISDFDHARMQRLCSLTSDYGSEDQEVDNQKTVLPCYDTMGNSLITRRFIKRRHSSPIVPEHLVLQMSRASVTPHTAGHGHSHMANISDLKSQDWVNNLRSLIIVLALSFHAVFEGLAVGLQQNVQDVWYLFYAIAAHKLVIAFCVGLELISGGTKTFLTVIYMVVFALVTPLGIAIGIIVTEGASSPDSFGHMWTVAVLQGFAGGTILYVTFCEVLERERNRKNGRFLKLLALVVGFSTMAIIELVGAHKHSH